MALPTDIIRFFHPDNIYDKLPTFKDFLESYKQNLTATQLNTIIRKLHLAGFLIERTRDWDGNPLNASYQTVNIIENNAKYGVYDFIVLGFPYIRKEFSKSVFFMPVKCIDGCETNGTAFWLEFCGNPYVITAKHNILENGFKVMSRNGTSLQIRQVWATCSEDYSEIGDSMIDIAVLLVDSPMLPFIKPFELDCGEVLDDILTMGFPPIPGFDIIQVSETAIIAAKKSTTGKITGCAFSYLGKQDYLLISARIKGGNSGGPVINNKGKVVGMVTALPMKDHKDDPIGYGIAIPHITIFDVLCSIAEREDKIKVKKLNFTNDLEGWIKINETDKKCIGFK